MSTITEQLPEEHLEELGEVNQLGGFEFKNLEDPQLDDRLAAMCIRTFNAFDEDNSARILVHQTSEIGEDTRFAKNAGPVGRNSCVGEGSVVLGALFDQVRVGQNVLVDRKVHLGTALNTESLGSIIIGNRTIVEAGVQIFSPEHGATTNIGERVVIGKGSVLGKKSKPLKCGSENRIAQGEEIIICDDVTIAPKTIILPGVYIGEGSKIGAGYRLAEGLELPPGTVIADNPLLGMMHPFKPRTVDLTWIKRKHSPVTFTGDQSID